MISADDMAMLREDLGREPRGAVDVAARCACGRPLVVTTAPRLPDGAPFPTTFYLAGPKLVAGCSTLEAEHLMEDYNALLAADEEVAEQYRAAHADYIARRDAVGEQVGTGVVEEISGVSAGGMPTRVKCLHALVGHALAAGPGVNPIGDLALAELQRRGYWDPEGCRCQGSTQTLAPKGAAE